jgi:hypothetical protein
MDGRQSSGVIEKFQKFHTLSRLFLILKDQQLRNHEKSWGCCTMILGKSKSNSNSVGLFHKNFLRDTLASSS